MTKHLQATRRIIPAIGLALLLGAILLAACSPAPTASPAPQPTQTVTAPAPTQAPPFRIVGYTSYGGFTAVNVLQFDKLTHINYAFLIPNADGTFTDIGQAQGLDRLAAVAHQRGVKVLVSVGGWGYDAQFEKLAADPATRSLFTGGLLKFIDKYNLDGVDMDWEFPLPGASAQNYASMMRELGGLLHAENKLLTAAVAALGSNADTILPAVFEDVDFLNLMVYDGSAQNHSPYEYAQQSLAYWSGRGLPASKAVLGVPFYARPLDVPYRKLALADPKAFDNDQFDYYGTMVYYNGAATLRLKTALAQQQASGIMIWRLEDDASGDASLLKVIYQATAP